HCSRCRISAACEIVRRSRDLIGRLSKRVAKTFRSFEYWSTGFFQSCLEGSMAFGHTCCECSPYFSLHRFGSAGTGLIERSHGLEDYARRIALCLPKALKHLSQHFILSASRCI